jgi:uncharacterized protein
VFDLDSRIYTEKDRLILGRAGAHALDMAVLLGALIGAAIALTGVGAGVITAPVLMLWLGVPPATAVGTALAFGAVVKIPAALSYWRQGHVDRRAAKAMILGGLPGVVVGALLLQTFDQAGLRPMVLCLVGLVVVSSALFGLWRALRPVSAPRSGGASERRRTLGWLSLPIGVEVGFSSAGAGALGTLLLLHATTLSTAAVVGTDLVFGLALSLVGGGMHVAFGAWQPELLLQLVAGGVVGALLGTRLAGVLPNRVLRVGLLLWLTYVGSTMTVQGVGDLVVSDARGASR